MMKKIEKEETGKASEQETPPLEVQQIFDNNQRNPQRSYLSPRCSKVAAIIVGNDSVGFPEHVSAVQSRSTGLRTIPVLNADSDPIRIICSSRWDPRDSIQISREQDEKMCPFWR